MCCQGSRRNKMKKKPSRYDAVAENMLSRVSPGSQVHTQSQCCVLTDLAVQPTAPLVVHNPRVSKQLAYKCPKVAEPQVPESVTAAQSNIEATAARRKKLSVSNLSEKAAKSDAYRAKSVGRSRPEAASRPAKAAQRKVTSALIWCSSALI